MKRKSAIVIAILIMCVGFAAISTTLIINGSTKVSENTEDFSVIFTSASLDGTDVYANVIDDTKKVITFETSDLKTLNQTSVLNYEVTNNSSNYDAEVTVNCKVKDNTTAKYTSIKNELEGKATVVKAKETLTGTLTVTLNKTATEEVKEEYVCTLEFNAIERDELGQGTPNPVSFSTDSWKTIQNAIQTGNTDSYNVGDTKEVDLGSFGTHIVRIANKSICTNGETSETACGFVVEFADIITKQPFNSTSSTVGGWKNSKMRTYTNETIYKSLPRDLQNIILTTKVISSYGKYDSANFETEDKLYLLSSEEVFGDFATSSMAGHDTSVGTSKQLDYYKNQGVTLSNFEESIKQYEGNNGYWWLRSVSADAWTVYDVANTRGWSNTSAMSYDGISPAFRIA